MRAVFIRKYGNNDVVQIGERPNPEPAQDDLLVQVKAASINPVDFKIRSGGIRPLIRYRLPLTLGNDLAGLVVATGAAVTKFKPGDAIYSRLDKDRIGAFADFALVRESAAALKPRNLSFEEAASIPLVGLTAWQAFREVGNLQAGNKVLIHAGSGGFGTFAIQLAKHLGAKVVTTASARNAELLKRLGADQVIDYRAMRFEEAVQDCDMVLDTQGGETLERSFAAVRPGGHVITIGGNPDAKFGRAWGANPLWVMAFAFVSRRVTRLAKKRPARFDFFFMHASGEQLEGLTPLLEHGKIQPVLDKTFPLAQTKEALAYSQSGRATGKIVIQVS